MHMEPFMPDSPGVGKFSGKYIVISTGLFTAGLMAFCHYHFIINHFYWDGAYFLESGLYSSLIWHNDFFLSCPKVFYVDAYYHIHVTVMQSLASMLSYVTPLNRIEFYAAHQAFIYTALFLGCYRMLVVHYLHARTWLIPLAAGLAVLFCLTGPVQQAVLFPHLEIAFPAMAILFLGFLAEKRLGPASLFFALALTVREDAGFHLVAFLGLLIVWQRIRGTSFKVQQAQVIFMCVAFFYSASALAFQEFFFPDDPAFIRTYVGNPSFAHITPDILRERLFIIFSEKHYLVVPALILAAWSIVKRDMVLFIGLAAYVPWFLLQTIAIPPAIGTWSLYYSFPFVVTLFWPLFAALWRGGMPLPLRQRRSALALFAILVTVSAFGFGRQHFQFFTRVFPKNINKAAIHHVADWVAAMAVSEKLGRVVVDDAVLSLRPTVFVKDQQVGETTWNTADTVIFFQDTFQRGEVMRLKQRWNLAHAYQFKDSRIRMFTRTPAQALPENTPEFIRLRYPMDLMTLNPRAGKWSGSRIETIGTASDEIVLYGPYVPMQEGDYSFEAKIEIPEAIQDAFGMELDVCYAGGSKRLAVKDFQLGDLEREGGWFRAGLPFTITSDMKNEFFEFRVRKTGRAPFFLSEINLVDNSRENAP